MGDYDFLFNSQPNSNDGTHSNSWGGTERMRQELFERIPSDLMDNFQIICSRVRDIQPHKIPILWLHDYFNDEENLHLRDPELRKRFKKLVFVSNHQFTTYNVALGVPYNESTMLRNAIVPIEDHVKPKDRVNIIYHTTPHRGLELLVPAFNHLAKIHGDIHLDVYSSFEIYGWNHRDKPYEEIFEFCRNHPNITYHGARPNSEVREALKNAHIFAYPSIWPETSCIAAMEAMSAGCAIVCSDLGALPETTLNYALMYRFQEDPKQHINLFASYLNNAITQIKDGNLEGHLRIQKKNADVLYGWDGRAEQWTRLLNDILAAE